MSFPRTYLSRLCNYLCTGPLAHEFPLLSLRTNKADVAVGVPLSVADALDARGEKWRVNGRYVMQNASPFASHRSRADMLSSPFCRVERAPIDARTQKLQTK